MEKFDIKTLSHNVFTALGEQWALLTAGDRSACNTMTVSWGGMGVLWGKNVCTVYVRPQRHTYGFMEQSGYFTLAFFGPAWREALALCGSKSGRDVDKIAQCGFTVAYGHGDAPYFEEAELVLVCRKLYRDDFDPSLFTDHDLEEKVYPTQDYHRMYIGEIVEAYKA